MNVQFPLVAAAAAVTAVAAPACAAVIDFSDTPDGLFDSYFEAGATFTAVTGIGLTSDLFFDAPNGTRGLISNGPPHIPDDYSPIRADFDSLQSYAAVDLGDFGSDSDSLFLRAYDQDDQLIAEETALIGEDIESMLRLEVAVPGIDHIVFGAVGVNGSSIYADNVEFVPVPGAGVLLGAGLAALAVRRRR